jgi:dTDP-4-dehydrorhamnose reductase
MKTLVFGAGGMLGTELVKQLKNAGAEVSEFDSELDVTDAEKVSEKIAALKPDIIFNCSAYNAVDQAEDQKEIAMRVNAEAPAIIAKAAAQNNAVLVHYSTGFIFDGKAKKGYNEDDQPNPISVYGQSKFEGEKNIQQNTKNYYIIRLNLLFGKTAKSAAAKKSFPEMILDLAKSQKNFDFVSDEISTPTYAPDLAAASIQLVLEKYPFGIYHLVNEGIASWADWAKEVFRASGLDININAISADKMLRKAKRPANSVLINNKFPHLRPWQQANEEFLMNKRETN